MRGEVEMPPPKPGWHELATELYLSLEQSGQSRYFEPSDWAMAQLLAEALTRDLKPQPVGVHPQTGKVVRARSPIRGASLQAHLKAFAALGVSESDRRRIGIFVKRESEKPGLASVTAIDRAGKLLEG